MNFMIFVASELREYMSKLGVRTVDELVGRIDLIKPKAGITGTAAQVDLSNIINSDYVSEKVEYNKKSKYDFKLENTLDEKVLMKEFEKNLKSGEKKSIAVNVKNTDRSFGTIFGSEITRKYYNTLADDTYKIVCNGSGGQSFGAFIPNGLTSSLWATLTIISARDFQAVSSLFILQRIPLSKPRTISLSVTLHFTAQQAVRRSSTVLQASVSA